MSKADWKLVRKQMRAAGKMARVLMVDFGRMGPSALRDMALTDLAACVSLPPGCIRSMVRRGELMSCLSSQGVVIIPATEINRWLGPILEEPLLKRRASGRASRRR